MKQGVSTSPCGVRSSAQRAEVPASRAVIEKLSGGALRGRGAGPVVAAIRRLYPREFAWLPPPYEYEREKMPIDILFGSPGLREAFDGDRCQTEEDVAELVVFDAAAWKSRCEGCRLYD
jgi:hypothetical protein